MVRKENWGLVVGLVGALLLGGTLAGFLVTSANSTRASEQVLTTLHRLQIQKAQGQAPRPDQLQATRGAAVWQAMSMLQLVTEAELEAFWTTGAGLEVVTDKLSGFLARQRQIENLVDYFLVAGLSAGLIGTLLLVRLNRARRSAEIQLRRHHQELLVTVEEEKKALSRDLHDTVVQDLAAAKMFLSQPADAELVALARGCLDQALTQVRQVALGLRPPSLDRLGFTASLGELVEAVSSLSGVVMGLTLPDDRARGLVDGVSDMVAINLYRSVQEALRNAVKHSGGTRVDVALAVNGRRLFLTVTDNGVETAPTPEGRGLGLVGLGERARLMGAHFSRTAVPGEGTRLEWVVTL